MHSVTTVNQMSPKERFELIWDYMERRIPVLLLGPAGSGKSYIGILLMKRYIREYFNESEIVWLRSVDETESNFEDIKALYVSGSANVTKLDLLGGRILIDGDYVRKPGIMNRMVNNGGILFLDEVTSLPPQFTILLNEIVDTLVRGDAHEDFYIFFAGNPSSYLGSNELPDSFLERVLTIWFDYYPFEYEYEIVLDMVKNKLRGDQILSERGFNLLVQYIISVLRDIREEMNSVGEICPISVRSMFTAVINTILLSRTMKRVIADGFSKTSIYQYLKSSLPDNLLNVWGDDTVNELYDFMERYNIGWNHVKEAIKSLGVLSKFYGREELNSILAKIPE